MNGENKLIINQETLVLAIKYWLNNNVLSSTHNTEVICVIGNRDNDKYTIFLNEKGK